MEAQPKQEEYEIPALGIKYLLQKEESGNLIVIREDDFEKLFDRMNALQEKVNNLQNQVIEDLKRQALIKNILNG